MDLDRGTLAKIDRRVLSGLGRDESYRMVRVPVSEAPWSAWKRSCTALGISMGRAIIALVEHELRAVVDEAGGQPVFLAQLEHRLDQRQSALDAREHRLEGREQRLTETANRIRAAANSPRPNADVVKVGRNDLCPRGSAVKYKRCHGG